MSTHLPSARSCAFGRTHLRPTAAIFCISLLAAGLLHAQPYPTKPVRMLIPFAAGGATDTVVRIVANRLPSVLGEQVVIDNRTGAGGLIGTEIASQASPDGYTLLATGTPHVIIPHLYKKISYDTLRDFEPIMQIGSQPYALTVHPSLGVTSVKELIALAKKQPGRINYASSGNGTVQHLALEMFKHRAGIKLNHIPYRGGGPVLNDLIAGQVKFYFSNAAASVGHVQSGTIKCIAHTGKGRLATLPATHRLGIT